MLAPSLAPDRAQIEIFVEGLFRHASPEGYVSVRAFYEDDAGKSFRISTTRIAGGLNYLIDVAEDDATRAAQFPKPVVFCPPIATFLTRDKAREVDLLEGLTLSVESDTRPRQARAKLEALLGPATFVIRSGGVWTDPATGETEDKLHLHWRLRTPARGDALVRLKRARDLAARLVGGDPTAKSVAHPMRWPGSWHRKGVPVMCAIETANLDAEIDLDAALAALEGVVSTAPPASKAAGEEHHDAADQDHSWEAQIAGVISGENYHRALVVLAGKVLKGGMADSTAVNMLRGLMNSSTAPHDDRWQARYDDIPRAVSTARDKLGPSTHKAQDPKEGDPGVLQSARASTFTMTAIQWFWPDRYAIGKLGLLVGLPDEGKGQIFADMAATATKGGAWPCNEGHAPKCNVVMLGAEDDPSDTVVPRLVAAGADLDAIEIISMVRNEQKKRMFSLVTDLPLLRAKIIEMGGVKLVLIDPISAYLGMGKVDTFRTSDVRAVLGPLVELAAELQVAIVGILHFNKKVDITNALLRISDSLAFGATSRHVYAVVDDAENKRKLMVKAKNNLAKSGQKALAYNFGEREVGTDPNTKQKIVAPHILWHPKHVDVTASEAMQASKSPAARDDAKKFLADLLASGPLPKREIEEAADANGIAARTLRRAKAELKVEAKKDGENGAWRWHAPVINRRHDDD